MRPSKVPPQDAMIHATDATNIAIAKSRSPYLKLVHVKATAKYRPGAMNKRPIFVLTSGWDKKPVTKLPERTASGAKIRYARPR